MRRGAMYALKMSLSLHAGSRVDQFQLDFLKERVPFCLFIVVDIVGVLTHALPLSYCPSLAVSGLCVAGVFLPERCLLSLLAFPYA